MCRCQHQPSITVGGCLEGRPPMVFSLHLCTKVEDVSVGDMTAINFNYFGDRTVTTSKDATITIRDLDERGGWTVREGGEIKAAHANVIWKASWAHHKFGQILATCSQDGTIKIWEELDGVIAGTTGGSRWFSQATISAERAVYDVRFAPNHLGLKLAAAVGDGTVRIHESTDPRTHTQWPQQEVLGDREGAVACLAWSPSEFEVQPMMVLGTSTGKVQIWKHDASEKKWRKTVELPGHNGSPVLDVAWAPWIGKHHRIASCGTDGRLQVHVLGKRGGAYGDVGGEWNHERSTDLRDGEQKSDTESNARRVDWHNTRAMLISCWQDEVVRVWRPASDGEWACVDRLGMLIASTGQCWTASS